MENFIRWRKYIISFFIISGVMILVNLIVKPTVNQINTYFDNEKSVEETKKIVNDLYFILDKNDKNKIKYNDEDFNKYTIKINKIENMINNKDGLVLFLEKDDISYVICYEKNIISYKSLGVVDDFQQIDDIDFMPLKSEKTNFIIVREKIDQKFGSLEKGTYIRVYYFDREFKLVLSLVENYEAYYNEFWSNEKSENHWKKITHKSLYEWNNEINPFIDTLDTQVYYISESINQDEVPDTTDFNIVGIEEFKNTYLWSSDWEHFIIGLGTLRNGEEIAILEDMSKEVFDLTGKNVLIKDKYKVKNKQGDVFVINKDEVIPIENKSNIININ